jgi:pimeloyl-ACP methyl ester carboxylesterase
VRIPVGPGSVHVERYGFGDRVLVLLHGFGTSSFLWRNVAPALPLGRVTVYAVDLFGWGESDRALDADFGIAAQAVYIDRALTLLRVARGDVVGVDMGAAVALALAARRASRVRTLVLLNPPDPARLRGDEFGELARLSGRHLLDASRGVLGAATLLGPILERSVAHRERMPRSLIGRYVAPFVGREGVRHLMQLDRAVNDRSLDGVEWGKIAVPALVVRGDADRWTPPTVAVSIASRLVRAEHRRMADAGRLIPEDAPGETAELLRGWIDGNATDDDSPDSHPRAAP